MDPPAGDGPEAIRNEKARILQTIRPLGPSDIVRGQYRRYREESGVASDSKVETYAAIRLFIDTWRWADVPFYIRTGKCLPASVTEVLAEFRRPPRETFGETIPGLSNHLRLRLGPEVVIALGVRVKIAGERMAGEDVELIAAQQPRQEMSPYERLLGDALEGDQSLFAREDAIETQWGIVEPVLGDVSPLHVYERNTWGPDELAYRIVWQVVRAELTHDIKRIHRGRVPPTRRTISVSISALTMISPLPFEWISPSLLNLLRKCEIREGFVPTRSARVS